MEYSKVNISHFTCFLGIYFFALILGSMNIGSFGSLLKIIGLIPVVICFIQKRGRIRISGITLAISLFVFIVALSYLWSIDKSSTLTRIVTQFSFLLLAVSTDSFDYSNDEIKYLKRMLVWSSRITVIFTLLFSNYFHGRIYLNGIFREDPNYLCAYFMFGVVYGIENLLSKQSFLYKFIAIIEMFVYAYTILSTGSRGGALAVLASMLISFYLIQRAKRTTLMKLIFQVLFIVIICVLLYFATTFIAPYILKRFSFNNIALSEGTGRYRIWSDALRTYRDSNLFNQIFGYGSGSAITIAREFNFYYVNVFHNAFIENLLEIGILGLFSYCAYIFISWNSARISRNVFAISVISGMIALSLSVSIGAFKPYWNIILFIIVLKNSTIMKENKQLR